MTTNIKPRHGMLFLAALVCLTVAACSSDEPLDPLADGTKSLAMERETGDVPPADRATLDLAGGTLDFWPYTGTSFDGTPVDPINLVFVGQADPLQIRAALMALDGDRSAFGIPPVPPFDAVWQDAIGGDVQTTCAASGDGWVGSIVQLTLGEFGPLRVHLRLFRTGQSADGGSVTLGGAHFEVQIPGTTEHEVLSWEIAEQIVTADLVRSGLLDASAPLWPTGSINAAPTFRSIRPEVYNGLPPELTALIGGPLPPVDAPVPLPSDGQGTVLNLAGAAPVVPGITTRKATVEYDQYVPRPFCAEGPGDWLYVSGPVDFTLMVEVDAEGAFTSRSDYSGVIYALPVDITTGQPAGDGFTARVAGSQRGQLNAWRGRIIADDKRLTIEGGGTQMLQEFLNVPQQGRKTWRSQLRCLDDE